MTDNSNENREQSFIEFFEKNEEYLEVINRFIVCLEEMIDKEISKNEESQIDISEFSNAICENSNQEKSILEDTKMKNDDE